MHSVLGYTHSFQPDDDMRIDEFFKGPMGHVTLFLAGVLCPTTSADVLSVVADRDNTMYEDAPGTNSNGAGSFIFTATQSSNGWARRALVHFDVSSIPAGSTINSAQLSLRVTQTISGSQDIDLHRVVADWGEAGSNAPGQEGGGTSAQNGDATWVSSFHPSTAWAQPGGDFASTASATASVGSSGSTSVWSSAGMEADVQSWVSGAQPNFGWVVKHTDEIVYGTAKRFRSRENTTTSQRPTLVVDFTPGAGAPGTSFCSGDGSGTACPCGNTGGSGEGCANDTGSGGALSGSGSASVGAADLVLAGDQLIPSQPGLYFQGNNAINSGNGNPFGDGLRCAGGGVIRLQVRFADSAGSSATNIDIGAKGGVSAGDVRRYQLWYRDPGTSPCNSLFNLSNGYEIAWSA